VKSSEQGPIVYRIMLPPMEMTGLQASPLVFQKPNYLNQVFCSSGSGADPIRLLCQAQWSRPRRKALFTPQPPLTTASVPAQYQSHQRLLLDK